MMGVDSSPWGYRLASAVVRVLRFSWIAGGTDLDVRYDITKAVDLNRISTLEP